MLDLVSCMLVLSIKLDQGSLIIILNLEQLLVFSLQKFHPFKK